MKHLINDSVILGSMIKKKKANKKDKIHSFFFPIPLYGIDVLILVGIKTREELKERFKRFGVMQKMQDLWLKDPMLETLFSKQAGTVYFKDCPGTIYLFREWNNDDEHLAILVHEISHMVDEMAKWKNIEHETEARAYLTDYLFRVILSELRSCVDTKK